MITVVQEADSKRKTIRVALLNTVTEDVSTINADGLTKFNRISQNGTRVYMNDEVGPFGPRLEFEQRLTILNVLDGTRGHIKPPPGDFLCSVSNDGSSVLFMSYDGHISVIDSSSGDIIKTLPLRSFPCEVVRSMDDSLTATADRVMSVYAGPDYELVSSFPTHLKPMAITLDKEHMICKDPSNKTCNMIMIRLINGERVWSREFDKGETGQILLVKTSLNGEFMAAFARFLGVWNCHVYVLDMNGDTVFTIPARDGGCFSISPDSTIIAASFGSGKIEMWDVEKRSMNGKMDLGKTVLDLEFVNEGTMILM
jgi:WD40 repeat protein